MSLPLGYTYSSVYAGIRKTNKKDLALIYSTMPASAAAVFTSNLVKAAPVLHAQASLRASRGRVRAVLINAGNANCATRTGAAVAKSTTAALARHLKIPANQVFPASTGVIGVELNPALITNALPQLVAEASPDKFDHVTLAIMTTDIVPKSLSAGLELQSGEVRIAGMTKGSGMIHPNMATTLGFVMTDARISPAQLQPILKRAIQLSYNRISVDGDQSTNDTVVVLANGASGVTLRTRRELHAFEESLTYLLQDLAKQIARDGEGARKLVTIRVEGARNEPQAAQIGRSIANSPLVKTAIAGADPNWGRLICAAGYAGVRFDPRQVDIYFQDVPVCKRGLAVDFDEAALIEKLKQPDVSVRFVMRGTHKASATFWTCDFTEGYIQINGSYRT
jgi:glutamate N-acetyltransferase/amino-acid N-acetyltransferase